MAGAGLALGLVGLTALIPATAAAAALPEVLLIVDASTSMQYRLFADLVPTCGQSGQPDTRSRWVALREIIGGSYLGYSCTQPALPPLPEAVNPPAPSNGVPKCIPGLSMTDGPTYSLSLPGPTNAGTSGVGAAAMTMPGALATSGATYRVPYLQFDWTGLDMGKSYPLGSLTVQVAAVGSGAGAPVPMVVTMVPSTTSPTLDPDGFCCAATSDARMVLSEVTGVNPVVGTTVQFQFTTAGMAALTASIKAGQAPSLALAYAAASWPNNCNKNANVGGTAPDPAMTFAAVGTSGAPVLRMASGNLCPSEGPTVETVAQGVDGMGNNSGVPAGKDGILDVFGPGAKFALLMSDSVLNKGNTLTAGFSFGPDITSYWGQANLGMQDPFAAGSRSVAVTRPDTLAARAATYSAIQQALAAQIANGPTPLGQQLLDAVAYVGPGLYQDAHFKTLTDDPVNGDLYAKCRPRLAVVLSDGGGNLDDGNSDGRATALLAASKLWAMGVPVHVIAIGHPADGASGPPADDLQFLHDLAAAGGTDKAILASTAFEAVKGLAPAISAATATQQVFTHPIVTLATGQPADVQHGFMGSSEFNLSQPMRSGGTIEQRIYACTAGCKNPATPDRAQVCEILNYSALLKSRSAPRLLYSTTAGSRRNFDSASITATEFGIGTVGMEPKLEPNVYGDCVTNGGYDLSQNTQREAFKQSLIDALYGKAGTCRQSTPLGAPARSTPAVIEPADRSGLREPSFQSYAKTTVPTASNYSTVNPPGSAGRPTVLYVATHDGLLHAFRTDRNPAITTPNSSVAGDEMWAWLPDFNLSRLSTLKLVTSADASYLGGAVTAGHVQLQRTAAMTIAQAAAAWRAVVVVGAGEGGSGYTALDVTAPEDPKLLWEIAPDQHCYGPGASVGGVAGPRCLALPTYKNMGRSLPKPAIANLFFADASEPPSQRAVAVIPMGMPWDRSNVKNYGVDGAGARGVFVVDLASGAKIREFTTADLDMAGIPAAVTSTDDAGYFWGDPACYNATPGQLVTRCYLGDSKGLLWRMDLSDSNPAKWTIAFFHDAYSGPGTPAAYTLDINSADRVPIVAAPSLASTSAARLVVSYGTGHLDDPASSTRLHMVYSLTEDIQTLGDGTTKPVASRNWVKALSAFERFVGPPLVFALNTYWASFAVQSQGACETGIARLWGARFDKPLAPSDPTTLAGAFANPNGSATKVASIDIGSDRPSPVDVQAVPACRGNCNPTDAKCVGALTGAAAAQALGGARPRYEVGVATPNAAVQAAGQAPKSGGQPSVGTVAQEVPQPRTAAVVTGWDLLVD